MAFKFSKENKCIKCELVPYTKKNREKLELQLIKFRGTSVNNLEYVINNGIDGISRERQDIVIDEIRCKKEEFEMNSSFLIMILISYSDRKSVV